MTPATWPRADALAERLLWIDPATDAFGDTTVGALPPRLRPGDLLVVNDAATLPASLHGLTDRALPIELRLVSRESAADDETETWSVVLFGAGDWRTKTEDRPLPPTLLPGSRLRFGEDLVARVVRQDGARAFTVSFDEVGDRFWNGLYRVGRPIQYSYVRDPFEMFHVQTGYAGRPWSVEMPSAGRPLSWSLLLELRRRGVSLASVTHAAGLSSSGDPLFDASLPRPERFSIPGSTVLAVNKTRGAGGRVIAVGTSVVRALEGSALLHAGQLVAGEGTTSLVLGPGFVPTVVAGLFTGIHDPTASHFALLQAFVPRPLLERAYVHAEQVGYLGHELGDSCLILAGSA